MRHLLFPVLSAAGLLALFLPNSLHAAGYPDRFAWVFGWGLQKDKDLVEITNMLAKAASSGINGAVLSASLDNLSRQSPDYFRRLKTLQQTCAADRIELIPSVFSVGYGAGALAQDRQLAEGLPVIDAPLVVSNRQARIVPDPSVGIDNGGFEEFKGHQFAGFGFHDQPGVISMVDTQVVHSGRAAIRLEHFDADKYGHGRVMQKVKVEPHRSYRMSLWAKTEGLHPTSGFQISVLAGDRSIAPRTFALPATSDWRKLTLVFNSLEFSSVNVYAGVWGGKAGKLWLDDWSVEEIGPLNVLTRGGTPVTVRSADGNTAYLAGEDYEPLRDPEFNPYNITHEAPALQLTHGSRIRDGQRLRVSWYHPMLIHDSQVTICMAEPELYEIYDREAKLLAEHLHPRRILLNMDEIRMGGTCARCRGQDMAKLLGQCITRQVESLRRYCPGAQIYIWSDMLDPNHNAHGNYYLVQGDFTGSWNYVPKDLIIAVWGGEPRPKSLNFFADQGFQSLVACYYDADDLKDVQAWMQAAAGRPGVRGFMYTPWLRKYDLLPDFGKMISGQ